MDEGTGPSSFRLDVVKCLKFLLYLPFGKRHWLAEAESSLTAPYVSRARDPNPRMLPTLSCRESLNAQ